MYLSMRPCILYVEENGIGGEVICGRQNAGRERGNEVDREKELDRIIRPMFQ